MKALAITLAALALFCGAVHADTINVPLVTVGDPGNAADPATGYGGVSDVYQIGKFDVTTAQYAAFLNDVATSGDPYGLYTPGMATDLPTVGITRTSSSGSFSYALKGNGNVPVFDVSWGDAARFVNWLQNGQPTAAEGPATTESGSYAMRGGTSNAALMTVQRGAGANWVLPNRDEWYKSAYYKGGSANAGYWRYPTQSNDMPSNVLSATGTNNANFCSNVAEPPDYGYTDYVNGLTIVGAFAGSPGPYGTFDQGGDVDQWDEVAVGNSSRETRGGSFADGWAGLYCTSHNDPPPALVDPSLGFRVAYVSGSVPEPGAAAMLIAAVVTALLFLKRRRFVNKNED